MALELTDVGIRFGPRSAPLTVAGVDLSLPAGGTVGLVGESGSGKSSIAKAAVGLNPVATGQITVDGTVVASPRLRLRNPAQHAVQLVFQDPRASLNPKMTVGETLREAAALHGATRSSNQRAGELLDMVRLSGAVQGRYPHEFSGGQLQRIAIARALAVAPRYLLLDEVTASLDVSVQATVLNLLRELQRELEFAMLYISHDLSVIRYVSDHVYVMQRGQVVEEGDVVDFFAQPRTEYATELLHAVPTLGGARWQR